ncbi:uncharacterized protein [Nicotiana sylvestris]|uniref:uncharacterized protein isoform X2 n=1 Tax=Nicotiana sylvestris TaxID=4096 RepID=UPI00388C3454
MHFHLIYSSDSLFVVIVACSRALVTLTVWINSTMGERLTINMITPNAEEWTRKIQENQVQTIMFNADITHFEDLFDPFHTYLVSVAQVKESSYLYANPLNKFIWIIDRSTIVEPIEKATPPEDPLPRQRG